MNKAVPMYQCRLCDAWSVPCQCFALTHGYVCAECVNDVHTELTKNRTQCEFFTREVDGSWTGKQSAERGFIRVEQAVIVECDSRMAP